MKVLFVGDLNVDLNMGGMESTVQEDREIYCRSFSVSMGSSAVITACHFARLGGEAGFCGLAGEDMYGRYMEEGLRLYGVDASLVMRRNVPTGVTVNLCRGRMRSQVTYPGTIELFDGSREILEALGEFGHVHFAGVYLQHAFRPRIMEILQVARKVRVTTSLDPQWDSSEKWEFMDDWLPLLDYLFVNEDEASSITGAGNAGRAWEILRQKTNCPVVKVGKRGVYFRGRIYPPVDVEVVDTTGAGDCFAAAFLHAVLVEGQGVKEAIEVGNREASWTCTFAGGLPEAPELY